jgi:hypothetical protein
MYVIIALWGRSVKKQSSIALSTTNSFVRVVLINMLHIEELSQFQICLQKISIFGTLCCPSFKH